MLQYLANGVVVGSIIAVTAIGLTLVYGILRLTNFAHGDMVTLGAYIVLVLNLRYGLNPWMGLPAAFIAGAGVAVMVEYLVWGKMRRSRASAVSLIVASIGVALALRNSLVFAFGAGPQKFDVPLQRAYPLLEGLPVRLTPDQRYVVLIALALVLLVHLMLRYTTAGKAMRAMSDNLDLAWACGVDVDRVALWTWVVGGGLAATGGMLYALTRPLYPELGWHLLLPMFAAIILGGIRNPYGAILGGFLIGIAQEMSVVLLRAEYKLAVGFLVMMLVLFLRPRGLMGEEVYR